MFSGFVVDADSNCLQRFFAIICEGLMGDFVFASRSTAFENTNKLWRCNTKMTEENCAISMLRTLAIIVRNRR